MGDFAPDGRCAEQGGDYLTEQMIPAGNGLEENELFSAVQSFSKQVEEDYRRYPHNVEEEP